jgi:hypothetical protein
MITTTLLAAACAGAPAEKPTMNQPILDQGTDGTWTIRITRTCEQRSAAGAVVFRAEVSPDPRSPPHMGLAEARALLSIAEQHLAAEGWIAAVHCGRQGLDALGLHYAPVGVDDSTDMKLLAAEDQLAQGAVENAARTTVRMLSIRIGLYPERHGEVIR